MASIEEAVKYVLSSEDSTLSGKVKPDPTKKDPEAVARFGINSYWHPELKNTNFFTTMPRDNALQIAMGIYTREYADRLQIPQIKDQRVANKLLDMYVNQGVTGIKLAQRACGAFEDGGIGPESLMKLNSGDPNHTLMCMANLSTAQYAMDEGTPEEHKAWAARAARLGV